MSSWSTEEEDISRDMERAEEYQQLTARATAISGNKYELSTGLIIAARYADKLRRVAFVALGKIVPKEIIVRDIGELNSKLYDELVNKMKVGKLDVIRIMVDVFYDEKEKKLKFDNIRITRYYTQEECKALSSEELKKLEEENARLKEELNRIKSEYEKIKSDLDKIRSILGGK
ncbi:MAG: DUF2258 domain-containing protein [Sulfolobaceae archaeon]